MVMVAHGATSMAKTTEYLLSNPRHVPRQLAIKLKKMNSILGAMKLGRTITFVALKPVATLAGTFPRTNRNVEREQKFQGVIL
jgi:hypothetical protein